jgi:predicted nucleotidyltransferase component of viral defense system
MIPQTILNRIINSAGIEDASVVLLDVLSVYLLQGLSEASMFDHMCFKGGNSLRKIFARRPSRFSRDLDFVDASYQQLSDPGISAEHYYYKLLEIFDGKSIHDIFWLIKPLSDEEVSGDTLRLDMHFFLYDEKPPDNWKTRADNVLALECSFRRPILLPPEPRALREESWFKQLEFSPSPIPVLQLEESIAEKIRAAFQRNNPRDIYDLYQYSQLTFDTDLVRKLAVLKCWQDRGLYDGPLNFDGEEFAEKLNVANYAWDKLKLQVADHCWVQPDALIKGLRSRYSFMSQLSETEKSLCTDRYKKLQTIHDQIWDEAKRLKQ